MANSPRLGMRLMATNDIQKEVIFNEALVVLDSFTVRSAKNRTNNPPGSPANGDTYIVGTAGTGAWSGHNNAIAVYFNGWRFYTPFSKCKFFNETTSTFWTWTSPNWTQDASGTPTTLDDLSNVGGAVPTDGQVLTFNETEGYWEPQTLPGNATLGELADVDVAGIADGQSIAWDETSGTWLPVTLSSGGGGASSLATLSDVDWTAGEPGNNAILQWNTATHKAKFQPLQVSIELDDLTDVDLSGASPNDVLAFNGSGWGPSPAVITYSWLGMVDGPNSMEGFAGNFLVVDDTESFLEFRSLQSLIDALTDFNVEDLTNWPAPGDPYVNRVLQLWKDGSTFKYRWAAMVDYSTAIYRDEEVDALTTNATRITFKGFDVTEPTPDQIVVQALNALEFSDHGTDITDPVREIDFTGALTVSYNAVSDKLTIGVEIPEPVVELGGLTDVDLTTNPPADGNSLVYDGGAGKWVPGEGSGTVGEIDGEFLPALYELGPYAPPEIDMFPNNTFAASADMDEVPQRGLVFSGGPQGSGVKHGYKWRNLVNNEEPWQITCRVVPNGFDVNGFAAGIALGRAFNNRFVALVVGQAEDQNHRQIYLSWVTGDTNAATLIKQEPNDYLWLRLAFDGNFIRAYVSADGLIFIPYGAAVDPATTLLGTPDRVGLVVRSNEVNDGQGTGLYTYYDDPDFPASSRIAQGVFQASLGSLQDVDLTVLPEDGQTIIWNEATGKWIAGEGGGGAEYPDFVGNAKKALIVNDTEDGVEWGPAAPETLGDIGDVDLSTPPTDKQALIWDDTSDTWKPGPASPESIDDIADVNVTGEAEEPYGKHAYWRLQVLSTNSATNYTVVAGLIFRSTPGGAEIDNTGGTAIEGGHLSSNVAARAFDNNDATSWESQNAAVSAGNSWVGMHYAAPVSVVEAEIRCGTYEDDERPVTGNVQYSDDGATWTTAWSFSGLTWTPAIIDTETITSPVYRPAHVPVVGDALVWDDDIDMWVAGRAKVDSLGHIGDVDFTVAPINGNSMVYDGILGKWVAGVGLGNVAADFDLNFFIPGTPDPDVMAVLYLTARDFTMQVDLEDSFAYCGTAPSGSVSFAMKKNGVGIGSINFNMSVNVATFNFTSNVAFIPGDRLEIWAPSGLSGIEDIAITIAGTRA